MRAPISLFRLQKSQAAGRGIAFQFTFDEWLTWWVEKLGPNWQELRGKTHGKYVMSRFGDKGPYHPKNVRCILATENSHETKLNGTSPRGERHGNRVVDEKTVLKILKAKGTDKEVADAFGINVHTIVLIKTKRTWRHLTEHLPVTRASKGHKGTTHHCAKLSNKNVTKIFLSRQRGVDLARTYKVSTCTIDDIKHSRTWTHVTQHLK